jgi:hypothetical protein
MPPNDLKFAVELILSNGARVLAVRGVHELLAVLGFTTSFAHQSIGASSTDVFARIRK